MNRSKIDFLEITSDHYIDSPKKKLDELELLAQHFPLIPHSLELSLGSAEGIDEEYLAKLADVVDIAKPAWFSDHICFTRSGGVKIGHLAPVPFTEEALGVFVRNVEKVKKRITAPLILENITYNIEYPWSEMREADFIRRLLEETDCGLLLDVTNLYINSVNLGFDWRDVLDEIPLERVVQVHFVGEHRGGARLIDAHSDATSEDIWNVLREVSGRCDIKGAILERDENFPEFSELIGELDRAREIGENENVFTKLGSPERCVRYDGAFEVEGDDPKALMALKQQQDVLARLYVDPELRSKFLESPSSFGGELEPHEAEGLARVAADEVRWFADSLVSKRLSEVAKLLPITKRAMGTEFDEQFLRFSKSFNPATVKKHLEDALAFAKVLRSSTSMIEANIAGWETTRLRHNAFGRRVSFCLLRFDPRILKGESASVKGIGFWIAIGGWSRTYFR